MTDYSELRRLAEACGNLNWRFQQENWTEYAIRDDHGYIATMRVGSPKQSGPDPDREAKAKFLGAMTPGAILALIAENELLSAQVRLAGVSAEMTVHQAVGRAATDTLLIMHERDQLKAENERLRLALKSAEDAMWKSEANMDNEAADIRDLLAAMDQGERSDG